jgi:hypothetical protein
MTGWGRAVIGRHVHRGDGFAGRQVDERDGVVELVENVEALLLSAGLPGTAADHGRSQAEDKRNLQETHGYGCPCPGAARFVKKHGLQF